LEENVEIRVPAGGEQQGCTAGLLGMAVACARVGTVWPGSCTLRSWWSRFFFGEAFTEACCSREAPMPYP